MAFKTDGLTQRYLCGIPEGTTMERRLSQMRSRANLNARLGLSPETQMSTPESTDRRTSPVVASARRRAMTAARAVAERRDGDGVARPTARSTARSRVRANGEAVRVWSTALDGVKPPRLQNLDEDAIVNFITKYVDYVRRLDRLSIQHGQQAQPVPTRL